MKKQFKYCKEDIKNILLNRKIKIKDLAKELGIKPNALNTWLSRNNMKQYVSFNQSLGKSSKIPYHVPNTEYKLFKGYRVYKDGTIVGIKGNKMNGTKHSNGYIQIDIKGHRQYYAHQLVAHCFLGYKLNQGLSRYANTVDHLNGNKHDNRVINLEVVTLSENSTRAQINN